MGECGLGEHHLGFDDQDEEENDEEDVEDGHGSRPEALGAGGVVGAELNECPRTILLDVGLCARAVVDPQVWHEDHLLVIRVERHLESHLRRVGHEVWRATGVLVLRDATQRVKHEEATS